MGKPRAFLPPPTCQRCSERPALGETLFHTGAVWICAACLTNEVPGKDVTTKMALREIQSGQCRAVSKRERAAGEIDDSELFENNANWNFQAMVSMRDNAQRLAKGTPIVNGEAIPTSPSYLRDTLIDPDLIAIESSNSRGQMLHANDIVALGIDVANTAGASNTHEKLIAHQIALAHKVAMEQANRASHARDAATEIRHINASARMMAMAQQGILTLQKLKGGGTHSIVVQHVHVEAGGQAVVGNVRSGNSDD
jgi:hypothetical protein